ncbi:MAG: poly-beta-1,6-N-acetyl-D-glucosamine synthase [bacterium]
MEFIWGILNNYVFLFPLFMSFVWSIGGLLFYFRRERKPVILPKTFPKYSILIAAHNEEEIIEETINNLEHLDYPSYEVVIIDDGSKDNTPKILDELAVKHFSWLKVIHISPNSGKAKALNVGIAFSTGEYILSIDADCFIEEDILRIISWHFVNFPRVGAVTGNPRIINRTSLLGKIQVGEFSSIIGLIKRAQRCLGKVLTVSGVIVAFRRAALYHCGLFDSDTVTEDIDITWKLQKNFWDVRYEPRAMCWIFAPETLKGLWTQRIRWAQGGLEVLKKHASIWGDWRQRRLLPVYTESIMSVLWACCFLFLLIWWITVYSLYYMNILIIPPTRPFIPPAWTGSILALICLIQFMTSLFIDSHYEKKSLIKYYFWVIWYPVFYWIINAVAVYAALFNIFVRKGGVKTTWKSPDRGLRTPE